MTSSDRTYVWWPLTQGALQQPSRPVDHQRIELRNRSTGVIEAMRPSELDPALDTVIYEWRPVEVGSEGSEEQR